MPDCAVARCCAIRDTGGRVHGLSQRNPGGEEYHTSINTEVYPLNGFVVIREAGSKAGSKSKAPARMPTPRLLKKIEKPASGA
jgi:hypothetical protein